MKKADLADIKNIAEKLYGADEAEHMVRLRHKNTNNLFEIPLPDNIGLKQHNSECASDSIQELVMFADGIREYTQPILYGLTNEQIELRVRLTLESEDWFSFQEYIHFIQKRFISHYDVLNYLRKHKIKGQKYYNDHDQVCLLNPLFNKKEQSSLFAGVLALKRFKKEDKYTGTGLIFKQTTLMLDNILKVFSLPYKTQDKVNKNGVGMVVASHKYSVMKDGELHKNSLGHVVSFFKTLGKWVYYDNNMGFIQVDETVIDKLGKGQLDIAFYKKAYFVETDSTGKYISAWSDGRWEKAGVDELHTSDNKLKSGIYSYKPYGILSVVEIEKDYINSCEVTHRKAVSSEDLVATMIKFRECIYSNLSSNSLIFEQMFRFLYESIELVKTVPEILEFTKNTISSIVLRPACTPFTHYVCHKIDRALKGEPANSMGYFEIPKLKPLHVYSHAVTPPELVEARREAVKKAQNAEKEKSPKYTPCLPGQVRDPKTLKCRDREKRVPKEKVNSNATIKSKPERPKVERCPKGETRDPVTGECIKRPEPCPPGQIRDRVTKLCKDRLDKSDCPEGQIRDPKTKKCRDPVVYKF